VADALENKANLMVEAGTGIGKSFAYLIPLIYWTMKEGRKAVIATGTKVLQNQLVAKDLPFLAENSDVPFKYEVLYGQENFFCRRRAGMITQYGLFDDPDQAEEFQKIAEWVREGSGIFEDYPEPVSPSIIVINHHLFFAHLESAGKLLPEFGAAIFDEAQRLEQIAASYFGVRLTNVGLSLLLSRIYNPRRESGILPRIPQFRRIKSNARALVEEARAAADNFFMNIANLLKPYETKKRIRAAGCVPNDLEQPLDDLAGFLFEIAKDSDDENLSFELISLGDRVSTAKGAVISFLDMADANSVYWIEASDASDRVSIHSALIDVSEVMRNSVWSQDWINILTSATLTVGKRFDFTAERIGFKDRTLWIGSPFDYQRNALTYVGHDLVSPKHEAWEERMAERVKELIKASHGRALVLFTSYATLNKTVAMLEEKLSKDHTVLVQGRATRNVLLEEFRFDTSSVLFATTSFWEGVDVPEPGPRTVHRLSASFVRLEVQAGDRTIDKERFGLRGYSGVGFKDRQEGLRPSVYGFTSSRACSIQLIRSTTVFRKTLK
jgi:ATP-dependent DNA helicase DinG